MAATPSFVSTPKITPTVFAQGTDAAGTYKTIYTAGSGGSKVVAISAMSNDSVNAHPVTVAVNRSSIVYPLVTVNVPTNAGANVTTASVDVLSGGPSALMQGLPRDNDGQKYLFLQSGDTLQATFTNNLNTSANLYITVIAGDF